LQVFPPSRRAKRFLAGERNISFQSAWLKITAGVIDCAMLQWFTVTVNALMLKLEILK
jgi:hypothetical protein